MRKWTDEQLSLYGDLYILHHTGSQVDKLYIARQTQDAWTPQRREDFESWLCRVVKLPLVHRHQLRKEEMARLRLKMVQGR